jgi:hypothetical protein
MTNLAPLLAWYAGLGGTGYKTLIRNGLPQRPQYPWDSVQLSKQERKGKSHDEMQALREQKYEALKKWEE